MIRRLYQIIAVLAVIHLLALGGFIGVLWSRGTLNVERIEKIAGVLRGEHDAAEEAPPHAGTNGVGAEEMSPESIARGQTSEELARFKSERSRAELDQQLALVTREMLRVREERDRFEAQRTRDAEVAKKKSEQTQQAGFQKQLQYFESLKPAVALELLLGREDEEAANLLKAMETRKGRKIIEAAKTAAQKKKLDGIMRLLPELDTGALSAEAPREGGRSMP